MGGGGDNVAVRKGNDSGLEQKGSIAQVTLLNRLPQGKCNKEVHEGFFRPCFWDSTSWYGPVCEAYSCTYRLGPTADIGVHELLIGQPISEPHKFQ